MPQREVLEHQGALGPEPAEEDDEDEGDHGGHHPSGRRKSNVDEAEGVSRRHRSSGAHAPPATSPSAGELAEAEVAVGDKGTHADFLRQPSARRK
jgi:hypothetical protein